MATSVQAPPSSTWTVVYLRDGEESFEADWACEDDAERFALWLNETGSAIDIEIIEIADPS